MEAENCMLKFEYNRLRIYQRWRQLEKQGEDPSVVKAFLPQDWETIIENANFENTSSDSDRQFVCFLILILSAKISVKADITPTSLLQRDSSGMTSSAVCDSAE